MSQDALGLDPSRLLLREHHPAWSALGEEEMQCIREVLGSIALDVQHVGSTSVAGLDAKPILDIAVALDPSRAGAAEIVQLMEEAGYEFWGDDGPDGGMFFARRMREKVVAQVHLVAADEPAWQGYVSFRDLLRSDSVVRSDYQRLKSELVQTYGDDREAYAAAKAAFIADMLASDAKCATGPANSVDRGPEIPTD